MRAGIGAPSVGDDHLAGDPVVNRLRERLAATHGIVCHEAVLRKPPPVYRLTHRLCTPQACEYNTPMLPAPSDPHGCGDNLVPVRDRLEGNSIPRRQRQVMSAGEGKRKEPF
jgi:hypothetical protein